MVRENSLKAYIEESEKGTLGKREQLVYDCIKSHPGSTSRQIMDLLGFVDTNKVRPRITKLIEEGFIVEGFKVKCESTGKTVATYYKKNGN